MLSYIFQVNKTNPTVPQTLNFNISLFTPKMRPFLLWSWPIAGFHTGTALLCHFYRLCTVRSVLMLRLIQAEGILPKQTTALTGGPSSVQTELLMPEQAGRERGRWMSRRRVRLIEEQEAGPCTPGPLSRVQTGMCPLWEPALMAPAGTSRCFLGIVVPPPW